jgi:hypothetical protein
MDRMTIILDQLSEKVIENDSMLKGGKKKKEEIKVDDRTICESKVLK